MKKSTKQWYLISYDIRNDKRLRRTSKHLEGYGTRIQYSLFRCHLGKRELERLRWELSQFLTDEDSLLMIGLCSHCIDHLRERNEKSWPDENEDSFMVI